jgi:hypothetical protein
MSYCDMRYCSCVLLRLPSTVTTNPADLADDLLNKRIIVLPPEDRALLVEITKKC